MSEEIKPMKNPIWIKSVFIASLALNLLVLGAIGGAWLSPDGPRGKAVEAAARDLGATPFVRAVARADRRELAQSFRQQAEPLQRNRAELRLRFDALLGALRAETFDRTEVASLMGLQRGAAIQRQEIGERVLIEYLSGLSFEERQEYADRLESAVRRGPQDRN